MKHVASQWPAAFALLASAYLLNASDGTRKWTRIWGSTDAEEPWAVSVDTAGYVYAAGKTRSGFDGQTNVNAGFNDIFVSRFTPDGTRLWTRIWGANADDVAMGASGGPDGAVYLGGTASGNFDGQTSHVLFADFFLSKVLPDGSRPWSRIWGTSSADNGRGVAVNPAGAIYLSGYTEGTLPGQTNNGGPQDFCLAKFAADGTRQWLRQFGSPSRDFAEGCAADALGNVYSVGNTEGFMHGNTNMGLKDAVLVKHTAAGARSWTRVWGTSGYDYAIAAATDDDGNIYVGGHTDGPLHGQTHHGNFDLMLLKFSPGGTRLWTRLFGSSALEECGGVTVDRDNNVYISGRTLGEFDGQTNARPGYFDCCLIKVTPDGDRVWTRIWGSQNGDGCLAADSFNTNAVYVTAFTYGSFDGQTNTQLNVEDSALCRFDYGVGGLLTISSENPPTNVPVTVSRADDNGETDGITPFIRSYGASWEIILTAPPAAMDRRFDRWRVNGVETTNAALRVLVDTNRAAHAVYLSDDFDAAWALSGARGSVTANTQRATTEPGEPRHGPFSGPYRSIWWSYLPPANGRLALTTYSSSFDTVLAVYTGSAVSNLSRIAANDDDGTPGGVSAVVVTNASAGVPYAIAVDAGLSWASGPCVLNWEFIPDSPQAGTIVINEFMPNPQAVADSVGEWVELRNTTAGNIDCTGWRFGGGNSSALGIPALVIPGNGFAVFCRSTDPAQNGGVSGAIAYAQLDLSNGADSLWLYDDQTQAVDVVMWTTVPDGRSLELIDPWDDNFSAMGQNWAACSAQLPSGDYGTPGEENDTFIPEPGSALLCLLACALRRTGAWWAATPRHGTD